MKYEIIARPERAARRNFILFYFIFLFSFLFFIFYFYEARPQRAAGGFIC